MKRSIAIAVSSLLGILLAAGMTWAAQPPIFTPKPSKPFPTPLPPKPLPPTPLPPKPLPPIPLPPKPLPPTPVPPKPVPPVPPKPLPPTPVPPKPVPPVPPKPFPPKPPIVVIPPPIIVQPPVIVTPPPIVVPPPVVITPPVIVAPPSGPVIVDEATLPWQTKKYLWVRNDTKEEIRIFVVYLAEEADGTPRWLPAANKDGVNEPLSYRFGAGEEGLLAVPDAGHILTSRVRLWATSDSRKWTEHQSTDLVLLEKAYQASQPETYRHRFGE